MKRKIKIKKRLLLFFIAIAVGVANSFAQDVITLKDGKEIIALVYEIGDIDVKYKKIDNPGGPNYLLKKSEIAKIMYANGSKDVFITKQVEENTLTSLNVYIPNGSQYSTKIDSVDMEFSNKVSYNNGNFTLKLKDIPEVEELETFPYSTSIIISDPNAQVYIAEGRMISAYKNGESVGTIFLAKSDDMGGYSCIMLPMYADRECQVSGQESDDSNPFRAPTTVSLNLSLKKGWNKLYSIQTGDNKREMTTTPPSGLEWRVIYYDE